MIKRPLDYWTLWILVISLVGGNIFVVKKLLESREESDRFLGGAVEALSEIQNEKLSYRVSVNQAVPFKAVVGVQETLVVPLKTLVPIDTTVEVPISLPLVGTTIVQVPIRTTVPIDVTIPIKIEKNIPIEGTTSLGLTVPIEIQDVPFGEVFAKINSLLRQLRAGLAK